VEPLWPPAPGGGRPRGIDLREVVDAILSVDQTGCPWRAWPHDSPPEGSVRHYFQAWRRIGLWGPILDTSRQRVRRPEGKENEPTAALIDSRSIKGSRTRGLRGSDAGKKVKGTKRHRLVDTMGLRLCVVVPAAKIPDRDGAELVFERARAKCGEIRSVWAEGGDAGKWIAWLRRCGGRVLEIVKRNEAVQGWQWLPRRWVVERTIWWLNGYRRLSRDDEYGPETSEAFLPIAMIHLMLHRLEPQPLAK
jgi:putative transposase